MRYGTKWKEKLLITFLFFKGLREGASRKYLYGRYHCTWEIINRAVIVKVCKPTEDLPCPGHKPMAGSCNTVRRTSSSIKENSVQWRYGHSESVYRQLITASIS